MSEDLFKTAVSEAITHIGISNYSSGKIKKYLLNKGYDISLVTDVVSSLIDRGYIDDRRASRSVLLLRTGKKRESKALTLNRLLAAGISEEVAEAVVYEIQSDSDSIKELFDSALPSDFDPYDENMRNFALKLAKQRGFTLECAKNELKNR